MTDLIVCATEPEIAPFYQDYSMSLWQDFASGYLAEGDGVGLLITGIGKTNSALVLGQYLVEYPIPARIINVGIGGAWPEPGVSVGDVVVATAETYGDEGVQTESGFLTMADVGFPLVHHPSLYNRFPAAGNAELARWLEDRTGLTIHAGPCLTVSSCSGDPDLAAERYRQFQPLAESMEGAALAHVAAVHDIPFLELRGISNHVGQYDKSTWRIGDAIDAVNRCLDALLED